MKLEIKNWNELTLEDYIELQKISDRDEAVDVEIGIVALLCGVEEDDIIKLPISEYQKLRREAQFISNIPEIKCKTPKNLMIKGKKYIVADNINKWITAQYIDFQNYYKMEGNNVPYILSTIIIPEGKIYGEGYDVAEVIDEIKTGLPVITAFEMCSFFQTAFLNSIKGTLLYLELLMKKKMRKAKNPEEKKRLTEIVKKLHQTRLVLNGDGYTQ